MQGRSRVRAAAKWGATVLCAAAAGAWVVSVSAPVSRTSTSAAGSLQCVLADGALVGKYMNSHFRSVASPLWERGRGNGGSDLGGVLWPRIERRPLAFASSRFAVGSVRGWVVVVPMWLPLALFGPPAAYLWWVDRRVWPGRCPKCRYDLAGLADGSACPECGEKAVRG